MSTLAIEQKFMDNLLVHLKKMNGMDLEKFMKIINFDESLYTIDFLLFCIKYKWTEAFKWVLDEIENKKIDLDINNTLQVKADEQLQEYKSISRSAITWSDTYRSKYDDTYDVWHYGLTNLSTSYDNKHLIMNTYADYMIKAKYEETGINYVLNYAINNNSHKIIKNILESTLFNINNYDITKLCDYINAFKKYDLILNILVNDKIHSEIKTLYIFKLFEYKNTNITNTIIKNGDLKNFIDSKDNYKNIMGHILLLDSVHLFKAIYNETFKFKLPLKKLISDIIEVNAPYIMECIIKTHRNEIEKDIEYYFKACFKANNLTIFSLLLYKLNNNVLNNQQTFLFDNVKESEFLDSLINSKVKLNHTIFNSKNIKLIKDITDTDTLKTLLNKVVINKELNSYIFNQAIKKNDITLLEYLINNKGFIFDESMMDSVLRKDYLEFSYLILKRIKYKLNKTQIKKLISNKNVLQNAWAVDILCVALENNRVDFEISNDDIYHSIINSKDFSYYSKFQNILLLFLQNKNSKILSYDAINNILESTNLMDKPEFKRAIRLKKIQSFMI